MIFVLGVLLFALGILISVALHEYGHFATARMFGMKVTRYFIGFGPTLFAFKKGEVEYGLKAIPAGAFVKIIGMTPLEDEEEVAPEDKNRVFWRKPLWQRTIVLAAGSIAHFIIGLVIVWILVSFIGIGNPDRAAAAEESSATATVAVAECIPPADAPADFACGPNDQPGPAAAGGIQDGDRVTSVNGVQVTNWEQMTAAIQPLPAGVAATITVLRDGQTVTTTVTPYASETVGTDGQTKPVSKIGVGAYIDPAIPLTVAYGPIDGIGETFAVTGQFAEGIGKAVVNLPQKVPALWNSLTGGERDPDTPVSVVGASRIGGELAERSEWEMFFVLLATLNFFIGVFNLLPLLPLDGGHIAIAWFEKVRSWVYGWMKKPDPGRVDYLKLLPVTYVVIVIFAGFTLLTVAADIVNPIVLFK
ncbi:M50 family metallopeptidase [Phytomonospora endophytica]|uniref:Membrane-associated protease RseP (Regulator of RpoE activity) n=1 Tax=Phytomonospora endophytica TaxID=714109 RepID=A0A841FC02_9ACTN|nr:site-2 protease family protein [Phytomonospora endophytica]MBB6032523.1 membrane-associated protease RseP (regulator of RpoE activity) [Phytomonospora endophytica]GIG66328.1 Zn-dependent protease [Phytomonospora endophytica]